VNAAELSQYFERFERSAFRLQLLGLYSVSTRHYFESWKAGDPKPQEIEETEWHRSVRQYVEAGKTMQMVHVVDVPLNNYVQYCLDWWYPARIAAGEDVRAIERQKIKAGEFPEHDFWMFDDAVVVQMNYDEGGSFIAGEELPSSLSGRYREYKRKALALAVPFSELTRAVPR
jgi:hypothetical protein